MIKVVRRFFESIGRFLPEKKQETLNLSELVRRFVFHSDLGLRELCKLLPLSQVGDFEQTFASMEKDLEAQGGNSFKLQQLRNLIDRGLEEAVCNEQGVPFIRAKSRY